MILLAQGALATAAENDWQLPQAVPESDTAPGLTVENYYGFLSRHKGYFLNVQHTDNEVNELGPDAEQCLPPHRRPLRIKRENVKWDPDHYL